MKKIKFVPVSKYTIDELILELNGLANLIEFDFELPENAKLIDGAIVLLRKYKKCQKNQEIPVAKKRSKQVALAR